MKWIGETRGKEKNWIKAVFVLFSHLLSRRRWWWRHLQRHQLKQPAEFKIIPKESTNNNRIIKKYKKIVIIKNCYYYFYYYYYCYKKNTSRISYRILHVLLLSNHWNCGNHESFANHVHSISNPNWCWNENPEQPRSTQTG